MRVSGIGEYQSEYLRTEELPRETRVEVESVRLEDLHQGTQDVQMLVVTFVGARKRLVLNKTRALQMATILGDETDGWQGQAVVLSPATQNGKATIHVREAR